MTTRISTHLAPFNAVVNGVDPFGRDGQIEVRPATDGRSRTSRGPARNPLLSQLDGSVDVRDMLRWATILCSHPNGLPSIVVVYLAFVYYHATRSNATWCNAHLKRFIPTVKPAVEALFPKFGDVLIQRAVENPQPWSMHSSFNKNNRYASDTLANIAGKKRPVLMPDDGTNAVTFQEILAHGIPEFRGYLQEIVTDIGCTEAIGFAASTDVKPWFNNPSLTPDVVSKRRSQAAKTGLEAVLRPFLIANRRPINVAMWPPILLARAPPKKRADPEREAQMVRAAQLCRGTMPLRNRRMPFFDGVTRHMFLRLCQHGRAYYGKNSAKEIMSMSSSPDLTCSGLSPTGCMFNVIANGRIVVTSAFAIVIRLLHADSLRIELYPCGSRQAPFLAQRANVSPFTREWQQPTMLPFVSGKEVRVNAAETLSWEFIHVAAERGADTIKLIGMTAHAGPMWNTLISNEFEDMVGKKVVVHHLLLHPKFTSAKANHKATRMERADIEAAGYVRPETIPVLCTLNKTARPTLPPYITPAAETMAAITQEMRVPSDPKSLRGTSKRPAEDSIVFVAEAAAKRFRGDE